MKTTYRTAQTIKPYEVSFKGWSFTIPVGAVVSNKTACGYDDSYRFWTDFRAIAEQVTGFKNSMLAHDLTYYGLNIPAEYCAPYAD